ncbi:Branched-chain amino acid ABC transporter, amino acid-binding protein [Desulfosporosinus sp. I2]|nr:Branched-chain amino acid ABC transporter, amino acid-binding protein [Desulfosporosinus sp. I2]
MKKYLKWLSMVVVTLLTVSLMLTGCGSSTPTSTSTSTAKEKVLTVGVDLPLTGPGARTGEEFKNAVDMAFTEVGYKIGDYKVKLAWIDDQSDPEKATSAYEQAVQKEKIDVSILGWNSSVAVALMESAAKYKIPHYFAFGATEVVNQKYASNDKYKVWIGKGWASPSKLSIAYVDTVNEAIKNGTYSPRNKKVAVYGEDTDWGRSFGATVGKGFKDSGWTVVNEEYLKMGKLICIQYLQR